MKRNYKSTMLMFTAAVFFTMACLTQILTRNVYATSNFQELLITEVMPMSQTTNDDYEYIELYNNSDRNIDLKDYKLPLQNMDITTSKVIAPKGILVICTKGSTTLDSFNNFYSTKLTVDKYTTLPFIEGILSNTSNTSILITKDDNTVVVRAQYETTDFAAKKGITYRYTEAGFDMLILGQNQSPTLGSISSEQVPQSGTKVTGIYLDKTSITIDVNQTAVLYPTIAPATATNKAVVWTSSNSSIVEVNQNGKLTSKGEGAVYVTATTVDGAMAAVCTVFVRKIPVTGITLDKASITMDVNQTAVLNATIAPSIATNKAITWTSNNSSIAEVSQKGIVTSKAQGATYVFATTVDGGLVAKCSVVVQRIPVTGVTLEKTSLSIDVGESIILRTSVDPTNATNKVVSFQSNNSNIASVDSAGKVVGRGVGEARITVTTRDGNFSCICIVTVKENENTNNETIGIRLNKTSIKIKEGKFKQLRPIITPGNLKKSDLIWTSSNEKIAYVSNDGRVFGRIEGSVKITVTTQDGKKATCEVKITSGKDKHKDKNKDKDKDEEQGKNKDKDKDKGHFKGQFTWTD